MMTKITMVPFAALLLTFSLGLAPSNTKSEVWSIDQSNSAGKNYGGTIYIWDLEKVNKEAVAERVDLGGAASTLCLAQTGANPVRPHMLTMNKAFSAKPLWHYAASLVRSEELCRSGYY